MQVVAASPDCFFTPQGRSCEKTQQLIETPLGCPYAKETENKRPGHWQGRDEDAAGVLKGYARATGAHGKLHHYYTPELALLVDELYGSDFEHFRYDKLVMFFFFPW
jgi:hypothetical protein